MSDPREIVVGDLVHDGRSLILFLPFADLREGEGDLEKKRAANGPSHRLGADDLLLGDRGLDLVGQLGDASAERLEASVWPLLLYRLASSLVLAMAAS